MSIEIHRASKAEVLRYWLRNGHREKAAEWAHEMAKEATVDELREIVGALADALDEIGGGRAKRGRPAKLDPGGAVLKAARRDVAERRRMQRAAAFYNELVSARDLLGDPSATAGATRDARELLAASDLPLDLYGSKFETRARKRAAKEVGVDERKLREVLTK